MSLVDGALWPAGAHGRPQEWLCWHEQSLKRSQVGWLRSWPLVSIDQGLKKEHGGKEKWMTRAENSIGGSEPGAEGSPALSGQDRRRSGHAPVPAGHFSPCHQGCAHLHGGVAAPCHQRGAWHQGNGVPASHPPFLPATDVSVSRDSSVLLSALAKPSPDVSGAGASYISEAE